MTINLGDKVKDTISGFTGIAEAEFKYLNGCLRIQIAPDRLDKDGKPIDSRIFDIEQIELVKAAKPRAVKPSGGPRNDPPQRPTPSR